jgi:beta-glucanase (GH16 family)
MRTLAAAVIIVVLALFGTSCIRTNATGSIAQTTMQYVFKDDFNGPAGSAPNPANWAFNTGATGWGNHELENYTTSRANSYLDGHGHLVIEAIRTAHGFTSARLTSRFSANNRTWEARIKFAPQRGAWPAFWFLGSKIKSGVWPQCGEIDVAENYGSAYANSSVHTASESGKMSNDVAPIPGSVSGWHIYRMVQSSGRVSTYIDGRLIHTVTAHSQPWNFGPSNPVFMILNLAVGGTGGGKVPSSFKSATMLIDYVHVW